MKTCQNCGSQYKDDNRFCFNCGSSLDITKDDNKGSSPQKKNSKLPFTLLGTLLILIALSVIALSLHSLFKNENNDDSVSVDSIIESSIISSDDVNNVRPITSSISSVEVQNSAVDVIIEGDYVSIDGNFSSVQITDTMSAIETVDSIGGLLGISYAKDNLIEQSVASLDGDTFYRLAQIYEGIPVYGKSIIVSANDTGNSLSLTSNYCSIKDFNITPNIGADEITKLAQEYIKSQIGNYGNYSIISSGLELIIYMIDNQPILSYYINIAGTSSESDLLIAQELILNANTGIVLKNSDTINFISRSDEFAGQLVNHQIPYEDIDNIYYMKDSNRNITVYDGAGQYEWYDSNNRINIKWSDESSPNESAVDAMANLIQVFTYYKDNLERNSFNNKGEDIDAFVNVSSYKDTMGNINIKYDNAFYSNSPGGKVLAFLVMSDGSEEYSAYIDIVAHEFTHGVVAEAARQSNGESGALSEAYADIIGLCIKASVMEKDIDWYISKIRSINTLTAKYNYHYVNYDPDIDCHYNSTIISYAAYLMWNGIDGNGSISINNADILAKLWYRSLLLLPEDATISQCRTAVELASKQLLKKGILNQSQVECVSRAFDEVGIAKPSGGKSVSESFSLYVYDYNIDLYDNYSVSIEGYFLANTLETYSNTFIVDTNEPVQLELNQGIYCAIISDLSNSSLPVNQTFRIVKNAEANELKINTDFGQTKDEPSVYISDYIKELKNLLDKNYELVFSTYNYKTDNAENILYGLIFNGFAVPGYEYYFGYISQEGPVFDSSQNDPLNKFEYKYYKLPEDNVDWIIENIFNSKADHSINNSDLYYYDGYYYQQAGDAGYIGHWSEIRDYTLLEDGKYSIICDYYSVEYDNLTEKWVKGNEYYGTTYIIAVLKNISDDTYWTFYIIDSNPINFLNSFISESEAIQLVKKTIGTSTTGLNGENYEYIYEEDNVYTFEYENNSYYCIRMHMDNNTGNAPFLRIIFVSFDGEEIIGGKSFVNETLESFVNGEVIPR